MAVSLEIKENNSLQFLPSFNKELRTYFDLTDSITLLHLNRLVDVPSLKRITITSCKRRNRVTGILQKETEESSIEILKNHSERYIHV